MYCRVCGKELNKNSKFCTECGTKVEKVKNSNNSVESSMPKSINVSTQHSKGPAIASMVMGIISIFAGTFFIIIPIIGLILGLTYKEKCGERTVGIVLNTFSIVVSVLLWAFVFFLIGFSSAEHEREENYYDNMEIQTNDSLNDYNGFEGYFNY